MGYNAIVVAGPTAATNQLSSSDSNDDDTVDDDTSDDHVAADEGTYTLQYIIR